jgi:drug/metabolite transporter (DMT)-like permease
MSFLAPRMSHRTLVGAALLVVYVVWGSTYLGIRVMVDNDGGNVPPFMATGLRFAIAGIAMIGWVIATRGINAFRVGALEFRNAVMIAATLLIGGTALVNYTEQSVPSGLTALIVTAVPLIVVVLRAVAREPIRPMAAVTVALGFVGVALLVMPGTRLEGVRFVSLMLTVVASVCWATGSFVSGRVALPADQVVSTTIQICTGALLSLAIAGVSGEFGRLEATHWTVDVVSALLYLATFGSVLAFGAYVWLLQNAPVSTVATYAYVNPIVALALGSVLLDERITPGLLAAAFLVIASVAATITIESRAKSYAVRSTAT